MKAYIAGFFSGLIAILIGGYLFVCSGGMPVATSSPPLPFEKFLARTALHAAYRGAEKLKSPFEPTDANLMTGAKLYKNDCAFCHGLPNSNSSNPAPTFFPPVPQLYKHGVADDPVGETYLKIKDGIRLSAMPGFVKVYTEEQLWQVSLLLSRGQEIPDKAKQELLSH